MSERHLFTIVGKPQTKEHKDNLKKAIALLESYDPRKQLKKRLVEYGDCFCAVGLCFKAIGYETKEDPLCGTVFGFFDMDYGQEFESKFGFWYPVKDSIGFHKTIPNLNDISQWSLVEIARLLRAVLEGKPNFRHDPFAIVTYNDKGLAEAVDPSIVRKLEAGG